MSRQVKTHTSTHTHINTHTHTSTYTHQHTSTYTHTHQHTHIHINTHTYTSTHAHTSTHNNIHTMPLNAHKRRHRDDIPSTVAPCEQAAPIVFMIFMCIHTQYTKSVTHINLMQQHQTFSRTSRQQKCVRDKGSKPLGHAQAAPLQNTHPHTQNIYTHKHVTYLSHTSYILFYFKFA